MPMQPPPQEGPQGPPQEKDPLQTLGNAINSLAESVMSSKMPDETKQQAQVVAQEFQKLQSMLSGGGGGIKPQPGAAMSGGNPNAQPMR